MKNLQRILLSTLLCCNSSAALAQHPMWLEPYWLNTEPYVQPRTEAQRIEETQQSIKMLIGNVSTALLEADHNMPNAALDRLGNVRQNLKDLDKPGYELKPLRIQAGRLDYTLPPLHEQTLGREHFALFPFEDGSFTIPLPERMGEKHGEIAINDAQVVFLQATLNIPAIKANVENAVHALAYNHSVEGANQLQLILDRDIAFKDEDKSDRLQLVYQDIMLAERLLLAEDYAFSRFTLYHARADLKQYASHGQAVPADEIKALGEEIQTGAEELKKEDPSKEEQRRERMQHWRAIIQKWINSKDKTGNIHPSTY